MGLHMSQVLIKGTTVHFEMCVLIRSYFHNGTLDQTKCRIYTMRHDNNTESLTAIL